jgi:hypothetical protein
MPRSRVMPGPGVKHGEAWRILHYALDMLGVVFARITLPVVRVCLLFTERGMRKLLRLVCHATDLLLLNY